MIFRYLILIGLFTLTGCSVGEDSEIEEVKLLDGSILNVERTEYQPKEFKIRDPFYGLPTMPRIEVGGPITKLKFIHPNTKKTIHWKSEQHYYPVLIEIVKGIPYLVVIGYSSKDVEEIYGCPELPYFYLKYETGFYDSWKPIPVDKTPVELRNANLRYRDHNPSIGYFQKTIPKSYDEWNYMYKNEHRNERKHGDCRPPLMPLADIQLPKAVDVELEIVESIDYFTKSADDYYKALFEKRGAITTENCSALIKPPNPAKKELGERFMNDPTGNIRLPYTGPTPIPSKMYFQSRTQRYCDDKFIWFVAANEEIGKTIITKYSANGPNITGGSVARSMVRDSMISENGYLYFLWDQNLLDSGKSVNGTRNRMTKFRFLEQNINTVAK